jgi:hypothetical protein
MAVSIFSKLFKKKKSPLFDRFTGTTIEMVGSYIEEHKESDETLLSTSIILLAMARTGYFLAGENLLSLSKNVNKDVLAFEALTFVMYMLRAVFEGDDAFEDSEQSDATNDSFGYAYDLASAAVMRETGWDVAHLFRQRLMQYASDITVTKATERFSSIILAIGAEKQPILVYSGDSMPSPAHPAAHLPVFFAVHLLATGMPACAETLQNIIDEYCQHKN